MTNIETLCREYKDLKRMQEELAEEFDRITDQIKSTIGTAEKVIAGPYKIVYKTITSNRIDTTKLKQEHPDIAADCTKETTSKRLIIQ